MILLKILEKLKEGIKNTSKLFCTTNVKTQSQKSPTSFNKKFLSLRQWAIASSIVLFIVTSALTICIDLMKVHFQKNFELLEKDLAGNINEPPLSSNEIKLLHTSQHYVSVMIRILSVSTYIGIINVISSAFMIYGVCLKKINYITPWILICGISQFLFISGLLVAYIEIIPGISINCKALIVSLLYLLLFTTLWYCIFLFYTDLTREICNPNHLKIRARVIEAYGGYLHTVTSNSPQNKKGVI